MLKYPAKLRTGRVRSGTGAIVFPGYGSGRKTGRHRRHRVGDHRSQRAEQALRESEEKYRDLVENEQHHYPLGHGRQFHVLNQFAEKFFGFSRDEILGKNVMGTIVPQSDSHGHDFTALSPRHQARSSPLRDERQ